MELAQHRSNGPGRIAYLCLETPREGQAVYAHVHEIIDGLRSRGWDVELIATTRGGSSSGSSYWTRLLDYMAAQWRLIRRLRHCDAIYMRAHFAALPASLIAALIGKPVVQEINGKPQDILVTYPGLSWQGAILRWAYRAQMRWAAHVIVVTEGLRTWALEQASNARVSVVGNGANVRLFTPEGPTANIETRYVAFVGGLVAWHGIETMLAALDQPDWPHGVQLVAIGDGVERVRFEAASGHPRLRWLGRQPYERIPAYLRGALAALCVIHDPDGRSATGVAPLKLYEAMACGVAVIVTDLPSQAELVRREGVGLVVPMADPAALARAVAALSADRAGAREMGSRGAAYVRAHASWQARADETGRIMQGLIGRR